MAGIYIHIPYCKKACHYCNFHFSVSLSTTNDFGKRFIERDAAAKELYAAGGNSNGVFRWRNPLFTGERRSEPNLCSVTPLLSNFAQAEITLEANPDDITAERLAGWKAAGINRLSIGIQSFFEEDLLWMNRAHNASQAKNCIALAREAGITNFSIDLIYGTPGLTDEKWKANVITALTYEIPHLSCYALTVEPGTALQKMILQHKKEDTDPEKQARHFLLLMDWLAQAGYEHYEISNFAKPGFRSRHNSSYWGGKKYLGLGPSAHSFNGSNRQWNIANNALYIQSLGQNKIPSEEEELSATQRLNEYIMTSLRTQEGLDLTRIAANFGEAAGRQLQKNSGKYIAGEKLLLNGSLLQLTREGKLFADGIAADLFFTENNGVITEPAIPAPYDDENNLPPVPPPVQAP